MEDGRAVQVSGDGSASPYGAYLCIKGRSALDFHQGAEHRLWQSQKRQADGSYSAMDAQQAMNEIAAQLQALIEQYGPRSVALYHGTGAYRSVLGAQLEKSFLSAVGSPNLFSTMTIDQSAKWVTAGRMGIMACGKPAFKDVDLAVMVGNNPLVTHQTYPFGPGECGAPGKAFAAAKQRGTRIIVIDPRATETARYADLLIQPLPGQDAVIFAAIAHILLRDGTFNQDFCERFVSQLDALQEAVMPFTPELAAQRADVPIEQIELAARWIGESRRPFIGSGTGPSMSAHSNLNDHMIEAVNALVGGYKRAGDRVDNPGTLNPRTRIVEMAVSPTRSWERGVKCRTENVGRLFGEFPTALLPQEILTPGEDKIRALIVFGGNPVMGLGDPERAIPAFEDLDLLVSLDARLNETAALSHYVIATSQPFERHDISIPGDALYPRAFAQYTAPVFPKPEGVIDDWEFFWGLASRMKFPLTLKYWTYGLEFDDIEEGMSLDMQSPPEPDTLLRFLCKNSRVSFDDLQAHPGGIQPHIEPVVVESVPDRGGRLELCPPDVADELSSLLQETSDTNYAYQLTSRRILEAMNSAYRDAERTRRRYPVNWAYMNPEDMTATGLSDGQPVLIRSETGEIRAQAKAEPQLRRGVVSMTHMFGNLNRSTDPVIQGGSFTGHLTSLERCLEPINFMPRFSGIPVNVLPSENKCT